MKSLLAAAVGASLLLGAATATQPNRVAGDPLRHGLAHGVSLYRAGRFRDAAAAFAGTDDAIGVYDRGDALARAGDYAAALDAFEAAVARDPADPDARANRALLTRLLSARAAAAQAVGRSGSAGVKPADRDLPSSKTPISTFGGEGFVGTQQSRSAAMVGGRSTVAPPRAPVADAGQWRGAEARGSAAAGAGHIGHGRDLAAESPAGAGRIPHDLVAERERRQATDQWLATIRDAPGQFLQLRIALEQQRRIAAGTAMPPSADPW